VQDIKPHILFRKISLWGGSRCCKPYKLLIMRVTSSKESILTNKSDSISTQALETFRLSIGEDVTSKDKVKLYIYIYIMNNNISIIIISKYINKAIIIIED